MIGSRLTHVEREAQRILERLRALEEISLGDASKMLKKSPRWIKSNLPVIAHGPRSKHVRVVDIEKYRQRRTMYPKPQIQMKGNNQCQ